MIIRKLVLENFRQFRGRQEVKFQDDRHPDRSVTVIFGANGLGKTGLFRGMIFCLFGERRLSQDGDVPNSEVQLVNSSALRVNPGVPVRTSVELEFAHHDRTYVLKRTISGMLEHDRVIEEVDETRLFVTDRDGNTRLVSGTDIQPTVNAIIDPRVKDYFLFDGEKIERLTRAGVEQRREISKGIRKLLNVDALEMAIRCSKKVSSMLDKELSNSSSEVLVRLLNRLSGNEAKQAAAMGQLDELASEIALGREQIEETDRALAKCKEISHLVERRKSLEQDLRILEQQAAEALGNMRTLTGNAATLGVAPTISAVFEHIDQQREKGDIPSEIRRDLIDRILSEHQCICGRSVTQGTEEHHRILAWQERTIDDSVQNAALTLWRDLSDLVRHLPDYADAVKRRLIEYGNFRNGIASRQRSLEQVRNEIGGAEREDASRLDAHRQKAMDKVINLEARALAIQSSVSESKREEEVLRAQLKEEKLKAARTDELSHRSILARDALDALNEVYLNFTQEIKQVISKSATEYLTLLLDKEGRENLRSIVVNDDYSLQVLDRWKRPFLANISAGQRQIMSLAFIAALAKMAAQSTHIDMPLFMDTPFGRLSYEHRRNLITQVPEFASQWILLATDTEFRRQEAGLLKQSQKWSKFFVLRPTAEGNTEIEEHELDSVLTLLADEERPR